MGPAAEVYTKFVVISFCACAHFTLTAALEVVFGQVGGTAPLPCADALKQRATGYAQRGSMTDDAAEPQGDTDDSDDRKR